MDIITHGLTGSLIGTADRDFSRRNLFFWLGCSLAPDLDMLSGLGGVISYYSYHRRVLHGLPGALFLILILALLYPKITRDSFSKGLLISGIAIFSHLFLDLATSFGTSLFYPFSTRDYSWDLLFAFDLWLAGGLIIFLVMAIIRPNIKRKIAAIGLIFMAVYITGCLISRYNAKIIIKNEIASKRLPSGKISVIPQPYYPLNWAGFITTPSGIWAGRFNIISSQYPEFQFYPTPQPDNLLKLANNTRSAQRFLEFARFPFIHREEGNGFVIFSYSDLRFSISGMERTNKFYGTKVKLDNNGRIISEGLAHDQKFK